MSLPFFTIGHSNRTLAEFVELLREAEVDLVADIRRFPKSRTNPQFNDDTLPAALAHTGIRYEHMAALGGYRGEAPALPESVNDLWRNKSFHNYADYALTAPFRSALEHLIDEGSGQRCAIMCSEAVWWRCHRRIVADYLIASDATVFHIMGAGRLVPARLTEGAVVRADGTIVYPAA